MAPNARLESVATKPNDLGMVPKLVEEIVYFAEFSQHDYHRRHLLQVARSLVQALETPQETVLRLCWAEVRKSFDLEKIFLKSVKPTLYGAITIAIDCRVFLYMSKSSDDPVHVDHLAQITDTDPTLIGMSSELERSEQIHDSLHRQNHEAPIGYGGVPRNRGGRILCH